MKQEYRRTTFAKTFNIRRPPLNTELENLLAQYSWENYEDAYGNAKLFPKHFQQFLETPDDDTEEKYELFNHINHQGSYYSVTAIAYDFFFHALPHVDDESRHYLLETVCAVAAMADCLHTPEERVLIDDYQQERDCLDVVVNNESILRAHLQEFPETLVFVAAMLKFDWPEIEMVPRDSDPMKGVLYFYELQHQRNPSYDETSRSCRFYEAARLCGTNDQTELELQMIWDQLVECHHDSESHTVGKFNSRLESSLENNPSLKTRLLRQLLKQKRSYNDLCYLLGWTRTKTPVDVTDKLLEQVKATKEFWEFRNRYTTECLWRDLDWFPEIQDRWLR